MIPRPKGKCPFINVRVCSDQARSMGRVANRTAELPNREFETPKSPPSSKRRSLGSVAPVLVGLTCGTRAIIYQRKISLKKQWTSWRRGWDSNPRYGYPYNGFRDRSVSDGNWRQGQFSVVAGPRFGPIFGRFARNGPVFGIGGCGPGFEPAS